VCSECEAHAQTDVNIVALNTKNGNRCLSVARMLLKLLRYVLPNIEPNVPLRTSKLTCCQRILCPALTREFRKVPPFAEMSLVSRGTLRHYLSVQASPAGKALSVQCGFRTQPPVLVTKRITQMTRIKNMTSTVARRACHKMLLGFAFYLIRIRFGRQQMLNCYDSPKE
jgi:hypothetical protein